MLRHVGAQLLAGVDANPARSDLWRKDLGIILDSAARLGLALPVVEAAHRAASAGAARESH